MTIIVDADAHICEPKDAFTSRMPSKYGDLIPHIEYRPEQGGDFWFVGDKKVSEIVSTSVIYKGKDGSFERRNESAGGSKPGWEMFPDRWEDQHPSSYDPNERVKIMDMFGISAATTYPNLGLGNPEVYRAGGLNDLQYQRSVVAAYNDWVLSWATEQPGRFIPLANVMYWDIPSAVKEVERCAAMGIKGLVMSGTPERHGCPILADPVWDPLWAAAQEANLSISFHAGGVGIRDDYHTNVMGFEALQAWSTIIAFFSNAATCVTLLLSGVLQRFPRLNFAIVETGVGWVPFALEATDQHYLRYEPWRSRPEMSPDVLPSELFRRQIFVNTWYEQLADQSRETFPMNNVMFETDYPHPTCLIGDEITDAIDNKMATLSAKEKDLVLYENALRCFNLTAKDLNIDTSKAL